ncbi:MAG: N-acetylglutaminylglutamine amidotransferase, partial [Gammaproteobacteria bacterium]|nr:N-acetylglutaminylglutamine amidotransferase [Gammaproteobacteria bacterium]
MCGICGELIYTNGSSKRPTGHASLSAVEAMADRMAARGPDGNGVLARGNVAFGHRRLKIVDLSERAAQPFVDTGLGLFLVFNGCIYNYRELRAELEALGHVFASHGDTEVVLKAWAQWGQQCVQRLQGMFAFALHELDSGRTALVRDRFGIKPLYYAEQPGRLRFASTLPALLAAGDVDTSIDRVALHHYMSWHAVVPAPHTILNGVRKLPAASMRLVEADGSSREHRYWEPSFDKSVADLERSDDEWQDMLLDALQLAVQRRMVADVPVGVLLSGGVDSSLIVGLLAEAGQHGLQTFSIGFEAAHGERGDEFKYSDLVAQRYATEHHKIFIESKELLQNLPDTIRAMSEPMVSYDNIGFYLLSREVSRTLKVVQSGQGADEVFAGYHWYPPLADSNDPVGDYRRAFFDRDHATLCTQLGEDYVCERDESLAFVESHFARAGANDAVDRALRLDTNVMLVD